MNAGAIAARQRPAITGYWQAYPFPNASFCNSDREVCRHPPMCITFIERARDSVGQDERSEALGGECALGLRQVLTNRLPAKRTSSLATLLEKIVDERVGQALVGSVSTAVDRIAEEIAREALGDQTFRRALRELVQSRSQKLLDELLRSNAGNGRRARPSRKRR